MKTTIHAAAGITAFITILLFLGATLVVELGGDAAAVAQVKGYIVRGLWLRWRGDEPAAGWWPRRGACRSSPATAC
jgi:hypothetical protein